jgi:hypothetical protein
MSAVAKKGRKTTKAVSSEPPKNIHITITDSVSTTTPLCSPVHIEDPPSPLENTVIETAKVEAAVDAKNSKKRGRKPKGGKLITKQTPSNEKPLNISNIVLHLKCSLSDIENTDSSLIVTDPVKYNPAVPPEILSADCFQPNELKPSLINETGESKKFAYFQESLISLYTENPDTEESRDISGANVYNRSIPATSNANTECAEKTSTKEINAKLKRLKINLYKNECGDKRSACFWCTYDFDSPPCYIPKYEMDHSIYGYGSFCRPECAAAYLMKENIDDSCKFERYHLLNQMYGKIFGYDKNIKLAPNPYYLLDKYYGNLTIQEYRKLLKLDHMLIVLEKPMTRLLPELHEDNDSVNLNTNVVNVNGNYKVKRQSEKQSGPSKTSIIRDCFNL